MTVEDQVYVRLASGEQPSQIMSALELRHDQYYSVLNALAHSGVLSALGDLPEGCSVELCPPQEAIDLFSTMADSVGWSQITISKLKGVLARYGCISPQTPDRRYNRSRWTGHTVRRVDFTGDSSKYMVTGFLVPRADNQSWQRATPKYRVVHVESDGSAVWSNTIERGSVVNVNNMSEIASESSIGEATNLALAIAYVCESRALLAHRVQYIIGHASESNTQDAAQCSCDPGPMGEHHDYCEMNHQNHPCDD
jgi:hypothetical protein